MNSSATMMLPLIRELFHLGYRNVRFYSYMRWNFNLVIRLYQEMPFLARTGEVLMYPRSILIKEFLPNLIPVSFDEIDEWAQQSISPAGAAKLFVDRYLPTDTPASTESYDEYSKWFEMINRYCPTNSFPVTEEPGHVGCPSRNVTTFYDFSGDAPAMPKEFPLPPGLKNTIDPEQVMNSAIAYRQAREAAKLPSKFQLWERSLAKK